VLALERDPRRGRNVPGLPMDNKKDRSVISAVHLRSRVPGTAGNRREQPTTSPSVFAGFPACSRLFPENEPIGE
jgi:hypothetical protein